MKSNGIKNNLSNIKSSYFLESLPKGIKISGKILLDIYGDSEYINNEGSFILANNNSNILNISGIKLKKNNDELNKFYTQKNINGNIIYIEDPFSFMINFNTIKKDTDLYNFKTLISNYISSINKTNIIKYITIAKSLKKDNNLKNLKQLSNYLKSIGYNNEYNLINQTINNFGYEAFNTNITMYKSSIFNILTKETIEQYYEKMFKHFDNQIENYLLKNKHLINKIKILDNNIFLKNFYSEKKFFNYGEEKDKYLNDIQFKRKKLEDFIKNNNIDGYNEKPNIEKRGYINSYQYTINEIFKNINRNSNISDGLIKKINRIMYTGIGIFAQHKHNRGIISQGYRKSDVIITGSNHKPPDSFQVANAMKIYFKYINSIKTKNKSFLSKINNNRDVDKINLLKVVTISHYLFTNIHPFYDGNGRTCRLLTNYILGTHGINPLIINNKNKELYKKNLSICDENNDITGILSFIIDNIM